MFGKEKASQDEKLGVDLRRVIDATTTEFVLDRIHIFRVGEHEGDVCVHECNDAAYEACDSVPVWWFVRIRVRRAYSDDEEDETENASDDAIPHVVLSFLFFVLIHLQQFFVVDVWVSSGSDDDVFTSQWLCHGFFLVVDIEFRRMSVSEKSVSVNPSIRKRKCDKIKVIIFSLLFLYVCT